MKKALFALITALTLPVVAQVPSEIAAHASKNGGPSELMVIQPDMRAKDLKGAFDYFKKNKLPGDIVFTLYNGKKFTNILEITDLPGGTMLVFKLNTTQGTQYHIAGVEEVQSVVFE